MLIAILLFLILICIPGGIELIVGLLFLGFIIVMIGVAIMFFVALAL